ncbi:hypothetical protein BGZ60DRAFT_528219 [Tricladium varicosporioides]|nr:hypothetical protein BGZ60DRAFT_528219 [Hymenoscyphus varicosporioides]
MPHQGSNNLNFPDVPSSPSIPTTNPNPTTVNTPAIDPFAVQTPAAAPRSKEPGRHKVKMDFVAETEHEISLKRGDIVLITDKADDDWWLVFESGRLAWAPMTYFEEAIIPYAEEAVGESAFNA